MTDQQEPLVSFRGIQKSYDGVNLIVKSLDLDISRGEFLTLLGPSGSGKTTCLMMLAGFETPTHGDILLDGQRLNNVPPHKRNIGMVFQSYALFPHLTVNENVGYPLSVRKLSKHEIADKVRNALRMVQLESLGGRYPAQLSGGQQQRIALARALVFEPQLVLMDEPLGALDKQLREHMQMEIKHLHQQLGVTVVYVTHDQSEALTMSDRVAVFNHGIIQQIDSPETLYEAPCNAFVANFIGENNALSGTVSAINGSTCKVQLKTGEEVIAQAINVSDIGKPASLSIRPERVKLNQHSVGCPNRFTGTVGELIYLGDHVRVRMSVSDTPDFVIKVPIAHLDPAIKVGANMPLGWDTADIRALDPL